MNLSFPSVPSVWQQSLYRAINFNKVYSKLYSEVYLENCGQDGIEKAQILEILYNYSRSSEPDFIWITTSLLLPWFPNSVLYDLLEELMASETVRGAIRGFLINSERKNVFPR